jgi:hypothetical protein
MFETEFDEDIKKLIDYMKTDEYFKKRRGNRPSWKEGGELISKWADKLWEITEGERNKCELWKLYTKTENELLLRSMGEQFGVIHKW